jgi:hypothetical protein
MEGSVMQDPNWTERLNAMQRFWLPPAAGSENLRQNAQCFWENQNRILEQMQHFTEGWFKRRHAGTEAALAAGQRMCAAENPTDLLREYQDWAVGAFERIAADQLAFQQELLAIAALIQPQPQTLNAAPEETPQSAATVPPRPRAV